MDFYEELERLCKNLGPQDGLHSAQEIEAAFGDLETRLVEEHRRETRAFAEGYDSSEVERRVRPQVEAQRELMQSLSADQQWGSQQAINALYDSARRHVAQDPEHQERRSQALAERSKPFQEQVRILNDITAEILRQNGHEPQEELREPSREDRRKAFLDRFNGSERDNEQERSY
jgi:hypothetical protein